MFACWCACVAQDMSKFVDIEADSEFYAAIDRAHDAISASDWHNVVPRYKEAFDIKDTRSHRLWYQAATWAANCGENELAFEWLNRAVELGFCNLDMMNESRALKKLDQCRLDEIKAQLTPRNEVRLRLSATFDSIFHLDQDGRVEAFESGQSCDRLRQDTLNLVRVERIIDRYGFWGESLATPEAKLAMWAVLMHAPYETQLRLLPAVNEAVERGELKRRYYAMLMDRMLIHECGKQLYGTDQQTASGQPVMPDNLIDPAHIGQHRQAVGLPREF